MMTKRERERQRKERAERAKELTRLNALRCDDCKEGVPVNRGLKCNCDAAVQIREIGKQLDGNKKKLTVEEFNDLKRQDKTDKEIGELFGITKMQVQYFKRANDLVNKHPQGRKVEVVPGNPIKSMTVEKYAELKMNGVTDKHIGEKYGIPSTTLYRWAKLNVDLIRTFGQKVNKDNNEGESAELLKSGYDAEQKDRELSYLRNIEVDYQKLEVDYRNERTENERLRGIIEDLKSTYQMNLWLMEQHIMLNKRVEGIVE